MKLGIRLEGAQADGNHLHACIRIRRPRKPSSKGGGGGEGGRYALEEGELRGARNPRSLRECEDASAMAFTQGEKG